MACHIITCWKGASGICVDLSCCCCSSSSPSDGRVVSNFIMQALSGEDITIYGDGGQTRSFCFVDDLIEGLVRLMNNEAEVRTGVGTPGRFEHGGPSQGMTQPKTCGRRAYTPLTRGTACPSTRTGNVSPSGFLLRWPWLIRGGGQAR